MADTLMYFKRLEAAGFSRAQAEAQVEMIREFQTDQFPTKTFVDERFLAVDARFNRIDRRLDLLEVEMQRLADRITIRLGGMMIIGFGAMAALIKLT